MIRDSVIDWQELSELYEQAETLDEAALAAFLEPLRAGRHRLLGQLERMLDARRRIVTGGFLDTLPRLESTVPSPAAAEWSEGSRVGAYRLIRPLGSGGMAEVWLAERADGAFQRQVALKLLFSHPSRDERERFVERFRRERDILASLQHPNIAGLHDAGVTAGGQPWLALEYVQGEPITSWCDSRSLDIAARVAVFRQVLQAVAYAHANLVIHRDLKPSNILVTQAGEVKLLDFGIAKLIEGDDQGMAETELTRQTGRPLTLMYASPEQMEGTLLTTASDVYSAGVVLYELVTRQRPYDTPRSGWWSSCPAIQAMAFTKPIVVAKSGNVNVRTSPSAPASHPDSVATCPASSSAARRGASGRQRIAASASIRVEGAGRAAGSLTAGSPREPVVLLVEPRGDVRFLVREEAGAELRVAVGDLCLQLRRRAHAALLAQVDALDRPELADVAAVAVLLHERASADGVAVGGRDGGRRAQQQHDRRAARGHHAGAGAPPSTSRATRTAAGGCES